MLFGSALNEEQYTSITESNLVIEDQEQEQEERQDEPTEVFVKNTLFTLLLISTMEANPLRLKVAVLLVFLIQCVEAQQIFLNSAVERHALLDLRSSLGLRSRDWPLKAEQCKFWNGVQCENGRVIGINISGLKRTRIGRLNPRFSVDSLGNLTQLRSFNASGFSLPGSIPDWFGFRFPVLRVLDLRSCSISGSIPGSLGNLSSVNFVYLSGNNLAGRLPSTLGQLKELSVLDLSHNSLTGSIPDFPSLGKLTTLDLSSNYLSGQIPVSLGSLSGIQFLNLSDNSLTGFIPDELKNLGKLVELDLSKNFLSGSLPAEFRALKSLEKLFVDRNELEGHLSDDMFSGLDQLQVADLSGNKFDGALPVALLSMHNLQLLDLSDNNFTGVFLSLSADGNSFGAVFNFSNNMLYGKLNSSLVKFSSIDLSRNYFQGSAASFSGRNVTLDGNCLQDVANQRSPLDCRLFYTRRGLSFDSFEVIGPTQPPLSKQAKSSKRWIFILVGVLGGLVFIVILVTVLVLILRRFDKGIANQRGSANVGPVPEGDSPLPPKDPNIQSSVGDSFTYEQLLRATGSFSAASLIKHGHSGDLFKGTLEGGTTVVVKKVSLHSFKKDSYKMELDLFNKVSHARLVPLLGQCLEHETDKLLVYKYMVCGDLASSLYRVTDLEDDGLQSLDWITRLKIAIGAAEGLSYLHHECNPPLVHRDVQASSILLDDKFEVRLGSLSEVRAQEGDSHQNVITRLLRKQASDPTASGSSTATCAYDIYCFGKVLLELVTGKLGISKSDEATTREWLEHTLPYISINDKEMVTKIVDPSLIVDEDLLEEVWATAIVARSCLNPKPSKRPPMKYILKALENPFKVVRVESFSSARLRTTSSRQSWSTTFFGSWRQSSSESATISGQPTREGIGGLKQLGRLGSHGSGGIEHSSSNKRLSNEIFPEPVDMQEMERQEVH
ncbi:probable LRR receptor-like serine/threonine-protein kinase At2g16250 isoform X2 [Mangifera indica]|uniref:probable LRR receptor-like serine/threonine-protein kinase At2g16250 isoform X2 n=1 Tax=Mangifera indica TaxID=29780 RepID=UPI001CFB8E86|nr:probable LRR receptor-like serine/threonine-protein kinase At2g16250 isoform X2 [Mangifera indica]